MHNSQNIINTIKRVVLIVEDEIINQEILKEILSDDYEILCASNGLEALSILDTSLKPISLILLDIKMPLMDGITFIKEIKKDEKHNNIPIIVLTSEKSSEIEALSLGAVDFIKKPYDMPEVVIARVKKSIELYEKRIVVNASERDDLTDLYNPHIFMEYVSRLHQYRPNTKRDMLVLNVSRFHLYNELYGREKGDEVLVALSDILKEVARDHDGITSRLQNDYFALCISSIDDYNEIVNYIYKNLKKKYNIENVKIRIGIYQSDGSEDTLEIIDRAKLVCDLIRNSSNDEFRIFNKDNQSNLLFKEKLIHDFKRAIEQKEFKVYYQPKINIEGDKYHLSSAEALIRWIHPELGFINPGMFIPLFENNGCIRELDRYVWNEAAHQIKKWEEEFNITLPVSVNISRVDMFDSKIVDTITNIVKDNGIKPSSLHLEITESAYNNETDQITEIINKLREKGFAIEIDDFGSGYSSLNTLATLPFDVLKLDMKFVKDMFKSDKTIKMVEIVSEIAKYLGVKLIAEGVETKEQLLKLKELNYHIIQGWYFSPALKPEEFQKLFEKDFN